MEAEVLASDTAQDRGNHPSHSQRCLRGVRYLGSKVGVGQQQRIAGKLVGHIGDVNRGCVYKLTSVGYREGREKSRLGQRKKKKKQALVAG